MHPVREKPLRRKSQGESSLLSSPSSFLCPPPVECGALPIFALHSQAIRTSGSLHCQAYPSISTPRILGGWSYTQSPSSHLALRLLCLKYYQHPGVHIRGTPQYDFLSFIIEQPFLSSIYILINQSINHLSTHLSNMVLFL